MSRATVLTVAVAVGALLGLVGHGEAQQVHVSLADRRQPTFFTCVTTVPYPATTPPGARSHVEAARNAWCGPGAPPVSGYFFVFRIDDGAVGVPAGKHVVQIIKVAGKRFAMDRTTGKCDKEQKFGFVDVEYFESAPGQPVLDHHIAFECCERRYTDDVMVATSFLPALPAGAQPLLPGFGAGRAYTTGDDMDAAIGAVEAATDVVWGHTYAGDTCNQPRQTPSGTVHWMQWNMNYGNITGTLSTTGN